MTIHLYCLKGPYPEFYCGKAKDLGRRLKEHRDGYGSKHTRRWKSFELFRSHTVEIKTESEAHFIEAGFTRQMREELPGMMIYGPGDHRYASCWQKKRKNPGNTFM